MFLRRDITASGGWNVDSTACAVVSFRSTTSSPMAHRHGATSLNMLSAASIHSLVHTSVARNTTVDCYPASSAEVACICFLHDVIVEKEVFNGQDCGRLHVKGVRRQTRVIDGCS
jgi:hypothetical protein